MAVELAGATSHQQLGQLAPLVEDSNLLALLLGKLSSRDRFCLAHLCRKMCHKVRAAVPFKLVFTGEEGGAVVIMPPSRTFRGAVRLTYTVGQKCQEYRAMVAMLRHAADTWPYLTRVTLECDPRCEALTSNPVALVGPLNSLALMPHLVKLSLSLPRLEDMEVDALAVLTSVTQLELISSHKARAVRGAGTTREPMCLPPPASLSALAHLRALDLEYVCAGEGGSYHPPPLPPSLSAVTITPAAMVEGWLPALAACQHLQQLRIQYDAAVCNDAPSMWQLLAQMVPCLPHLTALTMVPIGSGVVSSGVLVAGPHVAVPGRCFPCLRILACYKGMGVNVARVEQWRLLAACPALADMAFVAATAAPPPDLGQLRLTQLGVLLLGSRWAEAGALLRHCPLVEEVEVLVRELPATDVMPQTLPLVLSPLRNLRHVSMRLDCSRPQLVEVLAPSLSTTRSLELTMPIGKAGMLPDLSSFCHLTRLVYTVPCITATGEQKYPLPDDLLWCLRGCGGLVELTLSGWTWLDARIALAAAGAHPGLRRLRLVGCGVLPASSMCKPKQRLQNIRCLLRPSLRLVVV